MSRCDLIRATLTWEHELAFGRARHSCRPAPLERGHLWPASGAGAAQSAGAAQRRLIAAPDSGRIPGAWHCFGPRALRAVALISPAGRRHPATWGAAGAAATCGQSSWRELSLAHKLAVGASGRSARLWRAPSRAQLERHSSGPSWRDQARPRAGRRLKSAAGPASQWKQHKQTARPV